ncbi:MAG: lysophospholipid acyltransferase family protein [Gemmatimonadales bacterium]
MRLISLLLELGTALIARTWRIDVTGEEYLRQVRVASTGFVYALWHHAMLPLIWKHRERGTTMVISGHRDAEFLARTVTRMGYSVVRGSSTRGGVRAMRTAIRVLEDGKELAITPDGPRGPAGVAKPGIARVAARTGASILPVAAWASRSWRFGSWDGFMLPLPFAHVKIAYDEPLVPHVFATEAELHGALQERLDRVTAEVRCV